MDPNRKLPIGIQTFEQIRTEGYLYVDKTKYVWQLANFGKPYFLSRPRRFGKSLLLSTFKSYFEGRKDLFEGLALAELEKEWNVYPVLHLDLNAEKYDSVQQLYNILDRHLLKWEEKYPPQNIGKTVAGRFANVIEAAHDQTGQHVVVLIDEYDKPMLQTLLEEDLLTEYQKTLKAFYGVLKSADEHLKMIFLTGVTKFAHVSVFSDLNQLIDVGMNPAYATLCGVTHEELTEVFTPEVEALAQFNSLTVDETIDKLTQLYDGYHFREDTPGVFNPFSLLNCFDQKKFDNYWFQTGTPTFLVNLLKKNDFDLRRLIDGVEAEQSTFIEYRTEDDDPTPLIYQSGYLTVKDYDEEFKIYKLCFPNEEVKYAFLKFLLPAYSAVPESKRGFHIQRFVRELRSGDVSSFMERLKAFFADIPYELNNKNERHYQAIFYIVFTLIGEFAEAEVSSARGRADAVVKTDKYIYVFEFKLDGSAEEALRQIDDKGYLIPYTVDGRELVKVGVNFDKETRNIGEWVTE